MVVVVVVRLAEAVLSSTVEMDAVKNCRQGSVLAHICGVAVS
jgi:hypothetical protein